MDVHQKLLNCRQLIRKHWKVLRAALAIACVVFLAKALVSWGRIANLTDRMTLVTFVLFLASVLCGWAANKVYRLAQGNKDHRQTIVDVLCAYLRMSWRGTVLCGAAARPAPDPSDTP
ncbi:hypothetical protein ACH4U6_31355 [Streptomyces netropsis]|uniref:hypothetical protein n=1 Tax=Streptomyces netropsis TaxID=55404 RepID=UPI0037A5B050